MEEHPPLRIRIWPRDAVPPPNGLGGNDPSPDAPADQVNDSIGGGSSEFAPPDFNGAFGAFSANDPAIIRDLQAIEALLRKSPQFSFPPVEGYSPFDDPEADRGLLDYYGHRFIDVRSPDERRVREREIRREEQNAELVHSSGWMGTFASIATGAPTPTTWLPGGLVYRDGKELYVPGRVVPSSAVWPSPGNSAPPAPSAVPDAPRREDVPAPQADPSLDDTGGLGTPPTPEQSASPPDPAGIGLWDRMQLNGKDAYYRNTVLGSAELAMFAAVRRMIEAGASDDALIAEFYPALLANRPNQKGHRAAALKWLHSAPQRHKAVLADLALYDAMKGFESAAEGIVAAGGQIIGSAPSPESWVGAGIKGATWLGRAAKGGLQQAGVSVAVDPLVQLQSMAAGAQEKFDGWRTAQSGLIGAVLGGGAGAWLGTSSRPKPGELSAKETPFGARGEEPGPAPVAPEGEASDVSGKPFSAKERNADLDRRVAEVEEMAAKKPVSEKYEGAKIGDKGPNDYARTFHEANGTLKEEVEVHHAIEQGIVDWYPGLFTKSELNSLQNLRGIARDEYGSALHRSIIRKEWNRFYDENRMPTRQQVLDYATTIDRKYGGLFKPPL